MGRFLPSALFGGSVVVAVLLLGTRPGSLRAADAPAAEQTLETLQRERLEAARDFAEATKKAYDSGTITLDLVLRANLDLQAAELDVAQTPKERITALTRSLATAHQLEAQIRKLFEIGARGGEADKMAQAKLTRLRAEIALANEKLAQAANSKTAGESPTPDKVLDELRRERLEAARMFFEATRAAYETDTVTFDMLVLANTELLEAELGQAAKAVDRLAAYDRAVAAARAMETRINALHDAAARGGEVEKLAQARMKRLELEIAQVREQSATNK